MLMQKLANRTVMITGSSRGIGAETALAFAKEGYNVVITFLEELGKAEDIQRRAKLAGAESATIIHMDIKSDESIKSAMKSVLLKYGNIDILVNNAGVIRWKKFATQTDEDIEDQIATNLSGLIKLTKRALPHIKNCIINITSGAASHPVMDLSVYCATKYGVKGFTEVLAIENPKLNIYCVSPSMTSTEMTNYHGMPPERVAAVVLQTAKDGYGLPSGSDIKVWEVMNKKPINVG